MIRPKRCIVGFLCIRCGCNCAHPGAMTCPPNGSPAKPAYRIPMSPSSSSWTVAMCHWLVRMLSRRSGHAGQAMTFSVCARGDPLTRAHLLRRPHA